MQQKAIGEHGAGGRGSPPASPPLIYLSGGPSIRPGHSDDRRLQEQISMEAKPLRQVPYGFRFVAPVGVTLERRAVAA